ncbi:uncharacterized protein T551_00740 [Pneumocystis jirovecii RU7]|uniref:Ribosomal RNA-processing protein 43 n=1 Tax=Pneumocystis jirovecii (strain RU7) TaxID=1408657 RepID=A0A0W4ZUJ5_PNEJ7|nr:uncharacterized protein T551_00740 [Pneumocystis jirovecii RU7]KTW32058.1 hypothetical protein T551_00740 [Pneumocystis jirovecii RU7]
MAENTRLSFPPEVYKKIDLRQYFRHFLASSLRPDGRTPLQFRSTSMNTGSLSNTYGSSVARMGDTIFTCGIQAEITKPSIERPLEGWIVPHITFSPICSQKYKSNHHNHIAQAMLQRILSLMHTSNILPLSSLLISEYKAAWVLYVDLICLNYDGNAMDVAWIALISALETTKLPLAIWNEDTESVICKKEYKNLKLNQRLFSASFGIFDGKYILSDLNDDEESLISETINIIIGNDKQLLSINKNGGITMTQEMIISCIKLAKERYDELYNLIDKSK